MFFEGCLVPVMLKDTGWRCRMEGLNMLGVGWAWFREGIVQGVIQGCSYHAVGYRMGDLELV